METSPEQNRLTVPPTPTQPGRFAELKNIIIKVLIGCLVAAAGLAVMAVLLGGLSDILGRSLATLGSVALHALVALAYISTPIHSEDGEELEFFSNVVFIIIVLSFLTSVLGIWQVLTGDVVGKLYGTYFVLLFAALHGDMLSKTMGKTSLINQLVLANYVFMIFVVLMIMPPIWAGAETLPNFYYRVLAALGIIDATLTITAVGLHRLYLNKHPKEPSQLFTVQMQPGPGGQSVPVQMQPAKRRTHPLLILFGLYLLIQIVLSVVAAVWRFH